MQDLRKVTGFESIPIRLCKLKFLFLGRSKWKLARGESMRLVNPVGSVADQSLSRDRSSVNLAKRKVVGPTNSKTANFNFLPGKKLPFTYFATATSIWPVALLTFAAPHSVGLPLASNLQPNVPAVFAAHWPALTSTRYQPEPTGLIALLPFA